MRETLKMLKKSYVRFTNRNKECIGEMKSVGEQDQVYFLVPTAHFVTFVTLSIFKVTPTSHERG